MPAAHRNIVIEQGATFTLALALTDTSGSALDLTGCTAAMQVRTAPGGTLLATPEVEITDEENGRVVVTIDADVTEDLDFVDAVFDLEVTFPGSVIRRVVEGSVSLSKQVTA